MHVLQFGMDAGKAVWFEACWSPWPGSLVQRTCPVCYQQRLHSIRSQGQRAGLSWHAPTPS